MNRLKWPFKEYPFHCWCTEGRWPPDFSPNNRGHFSILYMLFAPPFGFFAYFLLSFKLQWPSRAKFALLNSFNEARKKEWPISSRNWLPICKPERSSYHFAEKSEKKQGGRVSVTRLPNWWQADRLISANFAGCLTQTSSVRDLGCNLCHLNGTWGISGIKDVYSRTSVWHSKNPSESVSLSRSKVW